MDQSIPADFAALVVEHCPDAIVYADAGGTIRYWNEAATRIFGHDAAAAVGASLDLIIPETLRGRHWQGYHEVMGGRPSRYPAGALLAVPAMRADGKRISVEFTILPVFADGGGPMLGIAAFLRDASARFDEMRGLRREIATLKAAAAPAGG